MDFVSIYLLSLIISISILFLIVKEAVRQANKELLNRTNTILIEILKQVGGTPENIPPTRQMLQKELDKLTAKARDGAISNEVFIEEQKRIEAEKTKLKSI